MKARRTFLEWRLARHATGTENVNCRNSGRIHAPCLPGSGMRRHAASSVAQTQGRATPAPINPSRLDNRVENESHGPSGLQQQGSALVLGQMATSRLALLTEPRGTLARLRSAEQQFRWGGTLAPTAARSLDDLIIAIGRRELRTFELAELLAWTSWDLGEAAQKELTDWTRVPPRRALEREACAVFRTFEGARITPDQAKALQELVRRSSEPLERVVVALLLALDEVLGPRIAQHLVHTVRHYEAGAGRIVPLKPLPFLALDDEDRPRPTANPDTTSPVPWIRRHFALVTPADATFPIEVDARLARELALLDPRGRIGTGSLNGATDEIVFLSKDPAEGSFFGVEPSDSETQWRRLRELMDLAEDQGCAVVVFPELSVSMELYKRLERWFRSRSGAVSLVVAGSVHHEESDGNRNSAFVLTRTHTWRHDKFAPFEVSEKLAAELGWAPANYLEKIDQGTTCLRLIFAGMWSLCVLVCKDFLHDQVLATLGRFRVRLVLVPALTQRLDEFEARAGVLASTAQSVVAVANNAIFARPGTADQHHAVFGRPLRDRRTCRIDGTRATAPFLGILGLVDEEPSVAEPLTSSIGPSL